MDKTNKNGELLKTMRISKGWTASVAAQELSISPQHLSRIENGHQIASGILLEKMIEKYQIPLEDAELLRGNSASDSLVSETAEPTPQRPTPDVANIKLDPATTTIQYTNAVSVSSDDFGIVIDAGQRVGPTNEIQIVSRIGFSVEHAEKISDALDLHIKKLKGKVES